MANLSNIGPTDNPELECDECGAVFSIQWFRRQENEQPEFCPFCGEEADIFWGESE